MDSPEEFDTLYKGVRDRLLVEAYALTGDLAVSRTAVRDAFAVAWHHWNTVRRVDDQVAWLRPHVWRRARNRHTARPWHRERNLSDDVTATLEALNNLSANQRKALTLTHLSPVPRSQMAREIGVTASAVDQLVASATADFSAARRCEPDAVGAHLAELRTVVKGRWPRSTIVRRAGTTRRRTHAVAGVMATVALVVASGTLVAHGNDDDAALSDQGFDRRPLKVDAEPLVPELSPDALLSAGQLERIDRDLNWVAGETHDNTDGNGLVLPCQRASFADPDGLGAYVRPFTGQAAGKKKTPGASAVQMVELSRTPKDAEDAYRTASSWFTGCTTGRTQLVSVQTLAGVGDEASVVTLRDWRKSPRTLQVGVARTGQVTVTTVTDVAGTRRATDGTASVLGAAVNALCGAPGTQACAAPGRAKQVTVPTAGVVPGMLSEFDLPPIPPAKGVWVGTQPATATAENRASSRCDNTVFTGRQFSHNLSRTFLFSKPGPPTEFGLTQSVGMMRSAKQATTFVNRVRDKVANCDDEGGTTVVQLVDRRTPKGHLSAWFVESELADGGMLRMQMAIMRHGKTVAQVGFVPVGRLDVSRADFTSLSERALQRLPRLRLEQKNAGQQD